MEQLGKYISRNTCLIKNSKPTEYNSFRERQDVEDAEEKQDYEEFMQRDSQSCQL
jgi:hypothetical protein